MIPSASLPTIPLPVTIHVAQCNNNPGGPIKLHNNTEWGVNTPRLSPSSQIHLPTNKSHVRTCDHSSETKFGYCIIPIKALWGSPAGSKTPANSARGAVPSGCPNEAVTIKKWTKQQSVTVSKWMISRASQSERMQELGCVEWVCLCFQNSQKQYFSWTYPYHP